MKSNKFVLSPSWNPVCEFWCTAMMGGRTWTSPSPKMPAGRMEVVRRDGWTEERFAARTSCSASALGLC